MRHNLGTFVALALLFTGCAAMPGTTKNGGPRTPVVLISIDGLRPEFYRAGTGWEAPTLQKLASQGASADAAEPIYPSLTYPSHATILTGARSALHGIYSNTQFSLADGPSPLWYWENDFIQMPTIWQRARAAGYKTAILTWPGTVGAQADWLIPEIFPAPPLLPGTTWEVMRANMTPAFADELVAVNGGAVPTGFGPRDEWVARAAEHVLREGHPDFALIHIIDVDHAEHESGKDSPEARQALKEADARLARILSAVDLSKTTVFLLGDHGFYDYDKTVRPNVLFAQAGWLSEERTEHGPVIAKDWKVITHGEGGAASIYTRDPKLAPQIVKLLKKMAGTVYRVIERPELDRLGAFPGAVCAIDPVTHVQAGPGYSVSLDAHGTFTEDLHKTRGNHGPLATDVPGLWTGLIAVGPGIAPGTRLGRVQLEDVAPTIARLIDVPFSEAEGKPIDLKPAAK